MHYIWACVVLLGLSLLSYVDICGWKLAASYSERIVNLAKSVIRLEQEFTIAYLAPRAMNAVETSRLIY